MRAASPGRVEDAGGTAPDAALRSGSSARARGVGRGAAPQLRRAQHACGVAPSGVPRRAAGVLHPAGRSGFTLLEIAVAIAILGVGVVTLQQIFQGGLRLQMRASRQSRAVLHARATMDGLLFQRSIKNHSEERTTQEGFRTRILVRDATAEEGGGPKDDLGIEPTDQTQTLRYVEVEVGWTDGVGVKTYTLRSLRLAREEEE